jgi:histidinol-phosphate/aromatic aminotransferase/cobyric acid decarboxylase-like protein
VNALAESAAVAALAEGPDGIGWVAEHATLAVEIRTRLAAELRALGFVPAPSAANFLFVPVARAQVIAEEMGRRGVLVRAISGLPQDVPALAAAGGEALRIGVGPWDVMERVLNVFVEALACA